MGIIKRQGIKNSIVNYAGVLIGMVNIIFVYPNARAEYGAAQWFMESSILLIPFILLGMDALAIRFFPTFKNPKNGHNGFLSLLLIGTALGLILFIIIFWFAQPFIIPLLKEDSLIQQLLICLVPLTCIRSISELLTKYTANFHRIVVPAVLNQLIKFTLPVLIGLFLFKKIPAEYIVYGVILNFALALILIVFYLKNLGELHLKPNLKFVKKPLLKEMGIYAGYGILGLLGTYLATKIDTVMVGGMLGDESTGTYSILLIIANTIAIPTIAIMKIASPIVSDAWNRKDLHQIQDLYKKTSLNLLIFGVLIFIGIWTCLDNLFEIMAHGEDIRFAKNVVLFIGLSKLVDMVTSINSLIIGYSKYFRFNFYAVLAMAVFNIIMNLIFIPIHGEIGAAMATLGTIASYNLLKFGYVKYKFDMQPFQWNTLWVIFLGIGVYLLTFLLPDTKWALVDIMIKAIFITSIFASAVLFLRLSPDVNDLFNDFVEKGKAFLNRN